MRTDYVVKDMMAFTKSPSFSLRAVTALAREHEAWDMTSSISLASTPLSSTASASASSSPASSTVGHLNVVLELLGSLGLLHGSLLLQTAALAGLAEDDVGAVLLVDVGTLNGKVSALAGGL